MKFTPQPGCFVWEWPLGNDAVIPIEYEVQRGEEPQLYGDAPHPGCPEEIRLLNVFINGEWLDFQDVFGIGPQAEYLLARISEERESHET